MATIHDVAREAGVSTATVSYVLTGSRRMGAETERRVREAAQRLGYRPNPLARGLRACSTGLSGVVLGQLRPNMELIEGLSRELRGMGLVLRETGFEAERERQALTDLAGLGVDALVWEPCGAPSPLPGKPVAFVGAAGEAPAGSLGCAGANAALVGALLREHLAACGSSHTLYLGGGEWPWGQELGEALRPEAELTALDAQQGWMTVARAQRQGLAFDSIVSATETAALGALRALAEAGLRTPEECAVACAGGGALASVAGITAVSLFPYRAGQEAGRMIRRHLAGEAPGAGAVRWPGRLTARGSTVAGAQAQWELEGL